MGALPLMAARGVKGAWGLKGAGALGALAAPAKRGLFGLDKNKNN